MTRQTKRQDGEGRGEDLIKHPNNDVIKVCCNICVVAVKDSPKLLVLDSSGCGAQKMRRKFQEGK